MGLVNGTRGKVLAFLKGDFRDVEKIQILFNIGEGLVYEVERKSAEYESSRGIFKLRYQFPISLAYTVTTHRAQGVTASTVLVDLGENTYQCPGLGYVALSRSKTLDGVHIIDLGYSSIYADRLAIKYYNKQRLENGNSPILKYNERFGNYSRIKKNPRKEVIFSFVF